MSGRQLQTFLRADTRGQPHAARRARRTRGGQEPAGHPRPREPGSVQAGACRRLTGERDSCTPSVAAAVPGKKGTSKFRSVLRILRSCLLTQQKEASVSTPASQLFGLGRSATSAWAGDFSRRSLTQPPGARRKARGPRSSSARPELLFCHLGSKRPRTRFHGGLGSWSLCRVPWEPERAAGLGDLRLLPGQPLVPRAICLIASFVGIKNSLTGSVS